MPYHMERICYFGKKLPDSSRETRFVFPPAMSKSSYPLTSSLELNSVCVLDFGCSDKCVVLFFHVFICVSPLTWNVFSFAYLPSGVFCCDVAEKGFGLLFVFLLSL